MPLGKGKFGGDKAKAAQALRDACMEVRERVRRTDDDDDDDNAHCRARTHTRHCTVTTEVCLAYV